MGRKPEPDIIRKTIGLHDSMWMEVAEYRYDNRIPTLAQALRELIEVGLAATLTIKRGRKNDQ